MTRGTVVLTVASVLMARLTVMSADGVQDGDARLVERVVEGHSLEDNLLGEPADRRVLIYLPPRYTEERNKHYPVVYLLSGLGGDHRNFARDGTPNRIGLMRSPQVKVGLHIEATADALIASGEIPDAILVGISGMNTYANHWFACSDTIGDYRSWIVRDIVRFVDREYRTRRDRNHRVIIGHSSGAFGALSLAIEYPDTFGAVGVLSPAGNDFEASAPGGSLPRLIDLFFRANPSAIGPPVTTRVDAPIPDATFAALWGSTPAGGNFIINVVYSAAAAFSPNPRNPPLLFDFPFQYPQKVVVPEVLTRWAEADLVSQVNRAPANLARTPVYLARGIDPTVLHPEVGDIPLLRVALLANGIVHAYDELSGDHFTSLPQAIRNALVFLLPRLGSQDEAPFKYNAALRDQHRRCRWIHRGRD
jgi:S-formylglutathione hydrolase FrmB